MKKQGAWVWMLIGVALVVFATGLAGAKEDERGRVTLQVMSVAAGLGYTWGDGVLEFRGHRYPFTVTGLSVVDVGVSQVLASGEVHDLKTPEDFEGTFMAVVAGATLAGGGSAAAMRNQNDVKMVWTTSNRGLSFSLGPSGIDVKFTEEARRSARSQGRQPEGPPAAALPASR